MNLSDLDFPFPDALVATERAPSSRVMWVESGEPRELEGGVRELIGKIQSGDVLVLNDTKVLKRRLFSDDGLEILFLRDVDGGGGRRWQVLCPSSRWKAGTHKTLPEGPVLSLIERGRTQVVESSEDLTPAYFERHGEMPLPPYIQKARGERHNRLDDALKYQTSWAEKPGSLAAPTASLHFDQETLATLRARGVHVEVITLHVGLGTFLPITVENLDDHVMHSEFAEISRPTWQRILDAKKTGHHVWALGTTVTRTLESAALGKLSGSFQMDAESLSAEDGATVAPESHVPARPVAESISKTNASGAAAAIATTPQDAVAFFGETDLFIRPGFKFQIVDRLLTNFHQPQSTLLALVAAFTSLDLVKRSYAWAIEREFRLFSYGDLSAWIN